MPHNLAVNCANPRSQPELTRRSFGHEVQEGHWSCRIGGRASLSGRVGRERNVALPATATSVARQGHLGLGADMVGPGIRERQRRGGRQHGRTSQTPRPPLIFCFQIVCRAVLSMGGHDSHPQCAAAGSQGVGPTWRPASARRSRHLCSRSTSAVRVAAPGAVESAGHRHPAQYTAKPSPQRQPQPQATLAITTRTTRTTAATPTCGALACTPPPVVKTAAAALPALLAAAMAARSTAPP